MDDENREYKKAITYLRGLIESGKIKIGSRLPTERAISQTLQISRNSTREALKMLQNMGIVESRRGSGNYLAGNQAKTISEMIDLMLLMHQTSQKEICDFRRSMELAVCAFLIENNKQIDWNELKKCIHESYNAGEIDKQIEADKKFHYMLIHATENNFWIYLMDAVSDVYRRWIDCVLCNTTADEKNEIFNAHTAMAQAIEHSDYQKCKKAINTHYEIVDKKFDGQNSEAVS